MLTIAPETLRELARLPFCPFSRATLLDRWALHCECSGPLRRLARFLLNQGVGTLDPEELFGPLAAPVAVVGAPSLTARRLPFSDERGQGWVELGSPLLVHRFSATLGQEIEWRRWLTATLLDHQVGTPLLPYESGYLSLLRAESASFHRVIPHRLVTFSPKLAPVAATLPFRLPRRGRAWRVARGRNGGPITVSYLDSSSSNHSIELPQEAVRAALRPCPESRLDFPNAQALRLLRKSAGR